MGVACRAQGLLQAGLFRSSAFASNQLPAKKAQGVGCQCFFEKKHWPAPIPNAISSETPGLVYTAHFPH